MLTERINYRYVKLVTDIIGIFASIGDTNYHSF